MIAIDDNVKVGGQYEPAGKIIPIASFVSQTGEDAGQRLRTYEESVGWYSGITRDIFG